MSIVIDQKIKLGVVNFLNATPLIHGISCIDGIELIPRVPSELIRQLEIEAIDVALASSIDYQRSAAELAILPIGVLSSDGESMTVQLCSRVPLKEIKVVHCDSDSHTSIALMAIILFEKYKIRPEIVKIDVQSIKRDDVSWPDSVLVIGDKVVTSHCENEYDYCVDLGQAWKDLTGLPFVFATWFARTNTPDNVIKKISMVLERQLACNEQRIEQVVSEYADERGWERPLAFLYLTSYIQYTFKTEHIKSIELFYALSKKCGFIEKVKPLVFLH